MSFLDVRGLHRNFHGVQALAGADQRFVRSFRIARWFPRLLVLRDSR